MKTKKLLTKVCANIVSFNKIITTLNKFTGRPRERSISSGYSPVRRNNCKNVDELPESRRHFISKRDTNLCYRKRPWEEIENEVLSFQKQRRDLSRKAQQLEPIRSNNESYKNYDVNQSPSRKNTDNNSNYRKRSWQEIENKALSIQKEKTNRAKTPEQLESDRSNKKSYKNYDSDQSPSRKKTNELKKYESEKRRNRRSSTESDHDYKETDYSEVRKRNSTKYRSERTFEKQRNISEGSDQSPRRKDKPSHYVKDDKQKRNSLPVQIKEEDDSDLSPSRRRKKYDSNQKRKYEERVLSNVPFKQENMVRSPQRRRDGICEPRKHQKDKWTPPYIKKEDSDFSSLERKNRLQSPLQYRRKRENSPIRIKREHSSISPTNRRKDTVSPKRYNKHQNSPRFIKEENSDTFSKRHKRDESSPIRIKHEKDFSPLREKGKYKQLTVESRGNDNSSRTFSTNKGFSRGDYRNSENRRSRSTVRSNSDISVLRRETYRGHYHQSSRNEEKRCKRSSSYSDRRSRYKMKEPPHKPLQRLKERDMSFDREDNFRKTKHSSSRRDNEERHSRRDMVRKNEVIRMSPEKARKRHLHRKRSASSEYEKRHKDDIFKKRTQNLPDEDQYSKSRKKISPEPENRSSRKIAVDSKKAGLHNASDLKAEMAARRDGENRLIEELSSEISGRDAEVQVRRNNRYRRGRDDEDPEKEKLRKERELATKEKYERWGKGLKQIEDHRALRENEAYESSKPLARYANDKDLERYLREQERPDDPMLQYMRQRRKEKEAEAEKNLGAPSKPKRPTYDGPYPENRFGIPPGHRWDGVDRSNGFEQKWFQAQSEGKARQEEAYKYSVEDM